MICNILIFTFFTWHTLLFWKLEDVWTPLGLHTDFRMALLFEISTQEHKPMELARVRVLDGERQPMTPSGLYLIAHPCGPQNPNRLIDRPLVGLTASFFLTKNCWSFRVIVRGLGRLSGPRVFLRGQPKSSNP